MVPPRNAVLAAICDEGDLTLYRSFLLHLFLLRPLPCYREQRDAPHLLWSLRLKTQTLKRDYSQLLYCAVLRRILHLKWPFLATPVFLSEVSGFHLGHAVFVL